MAIIQISKIQVRSGNLVDLPQLDEAELGWASDDKRLFIGKVTPNENIEVLTSYSDISFSQIDGSVGNLDINPVTIGEGQVLTYNANNETWENRGGNAGGIINLGDVANVRISGGAISYVLETDGTGNLTWAPKGATVSLIENVTQANPGVVTTAQDHTLVNQQEITITGVTGMTQLNGNTYYCNVISSNSFSLYSDAGLTTPVNTTGFGAFPYTAVTATTASNDRITVGSSTLFTANNVVVFIGNVANTGLTANSNYYVYDLPTSTTMRVATSNDGNISNVVNLTTQTGLSANVYVAGGRVVSAIGGSGAAAAGGSNTQIQYNSFNVLQGDPSFTFNYTSTPRLLTLNGNANVGNLNSTTLVTATRYISNIATGTAPLTVTSTTKVANLYVDRAGNSDTVYTVNQTTGTFFPVFVSSNATANYTLGSNTNFSFNVLTGNLSTTLLNVTSNANVGNIGATTGIFTGNVTVTSNVISGNVYANSGTIGANLLTGTLTTQAQPNITSLGNGTQVTVNGNFNPNANVTFNLGNSTNRWNALYLSGSTIYLGNATISSSPAGVVITNASGGSFTIGGASAANSAAIVNGNSNVIVTANSDVNISSNGVANMLVVTSTGANVAGTVSVTGNANVGNLGTVGLITATGNITGGNLVTAGVVTATGNITGGNLVTAGTLSVGGNANVGNIGATNIVGTLTIASQTNITAVGALASLSVVGNSNIGNIGTSGLITATGNITGGNISTAGTISAAGNANVGNIGAANGVFTTVTGALVTAAQPNVTSVGALTSLSVVGNILAGNVYANSGTLGAATVLSPILTTGSNTTAGTITGNWTLTAGSRMEATYADLAEYYSSDQVYEKGTVLAFGGDEEVTLAEDGTNKVAGVVSSDPAYVMNSACPGKHTVAIALQGRVPCKVRGKISKGDMMISAGNGYARPSNNPLIGTVIGKALENFDGVEGVIEIAIGRL